MGKPSQYQTVWVWDISCCFLPQHDQDWYNVPRDHVNWGKALNEVSIVMYHDSGTITITMVLG